MSTSFWMPDAKKDAGCCPSHWRTISDASICPRSIFLHKICTIGFVKHLSPYTKCIWEWIWVASSRFPHKKTTMACCSLQDDLSGNLTVFNVYKWHHSDVIVIKLTANTHNKNPHKKYISDFSTSRINGMAPLCKLIYRTILVHNSNVQCCRAKFQQPKFLNLNDICTSIICK